MTALPMFRDVRSTAFRVSCENMLAGIPVFGHSSISVAADFKNSKFVCESTLSRAKGARRGSFHLERIKYN